MIFKIAALDQLIHELTKLPGVGEKTAQRLAFFILKEGGQYSKRLQKSLEMVSEQVKHCPVCFSYTDQQICRICASTERDPSMICVVEQASDVMRIELAGNFKGQYHVLQGVLSPLEGVTPDDLRIKELVNRVENNQNSAHPVREVILALDADLEGDTTALYISKVLAHLKVGEEKLRITRIAHGVPFGSNIDYIDQRTLGRALENRVEI